MLPRDPASILRMLEEANAASEDSPIPEQGCASLGVTLGDVLLARLCRVSEASLRRYAGGIRTTPDAVAQRLHGLALIVADLRGAYNDYGIRRWFQRPRTQHVGRTAVPRRRDKERWTSAGYPNTFRRGMGTDGRGRIEPQASVAAS